MSRTEGITDEELAALGEPGLTLVSSSLFSEREKTALAYAAAVVKANAVDQDLFDDVRRHFSEEEIIELTAAITWEICAAKFNRALEIEWGSATTCRFPR